MTLLVLNDVVGCLVVRALVEALVLVLVVPVPVEATVWAHQRFPSPSRVKRVEAASSIRCVPPSPPSLQSCHAGLTKRCFELRAWIRRTPPISSVLVLVEALVLVLVEALVLVPLQATVKAPQRLSR